MCRSVLLCLLATLATGFPESHYCGLRYRRLCQGKGRHIACSFPEPGPGSTCERYTQIDFTKELQHFITNFINRRRQHVAMGNERVRGGAYVPKPQIMMLVSWDRELAMLAQRLADQCSFVHDNCRATVRYPYAGQTVGEVRWRRYLDSDALSAQRAIRRVLNAWWNERRRVKVAQLITPFRFDSKGTVWGHFTQLAVWNLEAVGCGAVRHGATYPRLLLVCDFSHTNMLGQKTILPGRTVPCPMHTVRRLRSAYPLLCGPIRMSFSAKVERKEDDDDDAEFHPSVDKTNCISEFVTRGDKKSIERIVTEVTIRDKMRTEGDISPTDEKLNRRKVHTKSHLLTTMESNVDSRRLKLKKKEELNSLISLKKYKDIRSRTEGLRLDIENKGFDLRMENDEIDKYTTKPRKLVTVEEIEDTPEYVRLASKAHKGPHLRVRYKQGQFHGTARSQGDKEIYKQHLMMRPMKEINQEDSMSLTTRLIVDKGSALFVTLPLSDDRLEHARERWKLAQNRPERPGASALRSSLRTVPGKLSKKQFMDLDLDKEDREQLFKDTGFSFDWRKIES